MKYLLTLILIAVLSSCGSDYDETNYITDNPAIVLNKELYHYKGVPSYNLYVYNGKVAKTYSCDEHVYRTYQVGDTLKNVTLITIRTEYCND